ncbi:MAG: Ppx/GppA family phosphatase [Myxococcota bacterium]
MSARAAIDIGSNSLLLTVVDGDGRVLHDEARVVGLGRGLAERGAFRADRREAAQAVLADYVARAEALSVPAGEIRAVATSAARRAADAPAFFEAVRDALGLCVEIVSGEEEARLTWVGAAVDLTVRGERLVVDLGGGSTELAAGDDAAVHARTSLEIGTVRLTEAHLCDAAGNVPDRFDPAGIAALQQAVDLVVTEGAPAVLAHHRPGSPVVGVAGTVTTLMAMEAGLTAYDSARVHGGRLTAEALDAVVATFADADAATRRRRAAVAPERADYLLAGAVVLRRVLDAAAADALIVSDRGLRFGLLTAR